MMLLCLIILLSLIQNINSSAVHVDAKFGKRSRFERTLIGNIGVPRPDDENFDKDCYDDYPVRDGLLCYPNCKVGYNNYGQGPVCWAKCPPETINIGVSCQKKTYGRGVGKPLSSCKSDMEKNGALCYPKCKAGYYGAGPICWELCRSSYTDDGAFCRRPLHIYGRNTASCPWYNKCGLFGANCGEKCNPGYVNDGCTCRQPLHIYAKKSYGRGVGVPLSCSSEEEQNAALCYPPCKSGYYGVGPVCWAHCSGQTSDTGAHCLKNNYGRGVGKALSCIRFTKVTLKSAEVDGIENFMKNVKGNVLTKAICVGLWATSKATMEFLRGFALCNAEDSWNTMVFSISGTASALLSVGVEIGIAVDLKEKKGVCYVQSCLGFNLDISIGLGINYGWFRSLEDIPGKSNVVFGGIEIPFTELGISFAGVTNPDGEYIGSLGTVGLGVGLSPLPFDIGGASCDTPQDTIVEFTP